MIVWLKTHCMFIQGCPHIRYRQESNPPDEHSEWVPSLFRPRSCRVLAMSKWQLMYLHNTSNMLGMHCGYRCHQRQRFGHSNHRWFFSGYHQWVNMWPLMDDGRDILQLWWMMVDVDEWPSTEWWMTVNDGKWWLIIVSDGGYDDWWLMLVNYEWILGDDGEQSFDVWRLIMMDCS